jgi:hypothetical protein
MKSGKKPTRATVIVSAVGLVLFVAWAIDRFESAKAMSTAAPSVVAPRPSRGLLDFFFPTFDGQAQLLYRYQNAELYLPDPLIDKLDIDDNVVRRDYQNSPMIFRNKLDETHINPNSVLVRVNPAPIRFLSIEEHNPAHLWHLYVLTGSDTAQLLEDGIHLRRHGHPEQILGGGTGQDDQRLYSEMGTILWRRDAETGGWNLDENTAEWIRQISISHTDEIKKHENLGPLYVVDCDALRGFAQPLPPGTLSRELTLKIDVPVTRDPTNPPPTNPYYRPPCLVDLAHSR